MNQKKAFRDMTFNKQVLEVLWLTFLDGNVFEGQMWAGRRICRRKKSKEPAPALARVSFVFEVFWVFFCFICMRTLQKGQRAAYGWGFNRGNGSIGSLDYYR